MKNSHVALVVSDVPVAAVKAPEPPDAACQTHIALPGVSFATITDPVAEVGVRLIVMLADAWVFLK